MKERRASVFANSAAWISVLDSLMQVKFSSVRRCDAVIFPTSFRRLATVSAVVLGSSCHLVACVDPLVEAGPASGGGPPD